MSDPATLPLEPLERAAFAPFGELVDDGAAKRVFSINAGTAQRFHDLATPDCDHEGGRTGVSLFRAQPRPMPR